MDELTIEEFKKQYMGKNSKWDFNKFKIVCTKCNSNFVEFNGFAESEGGYYGEHCLNGFIVVKCHNCGNAFKIDDFYCSDYIEFNTDGCNIEKFHRDIENE